MDLDTSIVESDQSRSWLSRVLLPGLLLLVVLAAGAWYVYQSWSMTPISSPVVAGVSTSTLADTVFHGKLFFVGTRDTSAGSSSLPSVYAYHFDTKNITPFVSNYPVNSFSRGSDGVDLVTTILASSSDPDKLGPAWYRDSNHSFGKLKGVNGYHENDIAASPDGFHFAFSYQIKTKGDMADLNNWNIALINGSTSAITTINSAAKPHWINHGSDLLYLKSDGIYRYHIATKNAKLVFGKYTNLSNIDDFTVSPDSAWLLLTGPAGHLISIIQVLDISSVQLFHRGCGIATLSFHQTDVFM